ELRARKVFLLVLSSAALRSQSVHDQTQWALTQSRREPERILLPILAGSIAENDMWLFLHDVKRIELAGGQPYAREEAIRQTLLALGLTPPGEAPIAQVPQPTENADGLIVRGMALAATSNYAGALPFFQRAAHLDARSFKAWQNLAYILLKLHR